MKETPTAEPGVDARWHAALAHVTGGLSPAALATAYLDWSLHLMASPEKQVRLIRQAIAPDIEDAAHGGGTRGKDAEALDQRGRGQFHGAGLA